MASLLPILGYSVIPVVAATVGAAATVWCKPGGRVTSMVQHLAAGVVFAAAAGELLPDMLHDKGAVMPVILGRRWDRADPSGRSHSLNSQSIAPSGVRPN